MPSLSIDQTEIARFSSHAAEWWDPRGPLRPLHKLNPARLEYIRDQVAAHFNCPLKGLSVLDIGCGGGLLCEPMARMGGKVTGLDASNEAIEAAKAHADQSGVEIDYICGSAEEMARGKKQYDVITALEILEHVADRASLLRAVGKLLKPGGLLILSTLNRTPKSFLLGIVAAEYILRWVPAGTHDWRKFIRPSELDADLTRAGLQTSDITGVTYNPFDDTFALKQGAVGMNYMMTAHGS